MADEGKLSHEINKGQKAAELLENPLLKEVFLTIETEINDLWKTSKTTETELREQAFYLNRALQRIRALLEIWVDNGKISHKELMRILEQEEKQKPVQE